MGISILNKVTNQIYLLEKYLNFEFKFYLKKVLNNSNYKK